MKIDIYIFYHIPLNLLGAISETNAVQKIEFYVKLISSKIVSLES